MNAFQSFLNGIINEAELQWNSVLVGTQTFNWKWIFLAVLVGVVAYSVRLRSLRRVYKRSAAFVKSKRYRIEFYKDLQFFAFKTVYKPFVILFLGFNVHLTDIYTRQYFSKLNLAFEPIFHLDYFWGQCFKILIALMAFDFGYFLAHYAEHRFASLWVFHKTHHRATALNPLTKNRIHPTMYFFNFAVQGSVGGVIMLFVFQFYDVPNSKAPYIYAIVSQVIANGLVHLRHSHVKIHYGWLSYILVSPVMHQVHHSIIRKHYDKNFAAVFSFWDLMFGTLYIPKRNEFFKFGLTEDRNIIPGFWTEIFLPFKELFYLYYKPKRKLSVLTPEPIALKIKEEESSLVKTNPAS